MKKNIGDTIELLLNYQVNHMPLQPDFYDEIEFIFGRSRYCLSDGSIYWDKTHNSYRVSISQADSLKIKDGIAQYQIRLRRGDSVISSDIQCVRIGDIISCKVI